MALLPGPATSSRPIPRSAKVHTSACQYCNVGCGYKIYTWPVQDTPSATPEPEGALGDWISPTFVTRAQVDGRDSYVAVVPDKDCIVNKGDHSPRGGTNALTVYTTRKHPLTDPTERNLYPQVRDARGGPLRRVSWDEALDRVADAIKRALDGRGPVVDRAVGRRPSLARDELRDHQALLRPVPEGSLQQGARPRRRRRGACDPQPPEVELRAPEHRAALRVEHHAAVLLPRLRAGRHDPAVRGQQLRDRHGALQPHVRAAQQEGRDRPAADGARGERRGPGRRPPPAQAEHGRRPAQLADERHPGERRHDQAFIDAALRPRELRAAQGHRLAGQVHAREHRARSPACRPRRCAGPPRCWAGPRRRRSCSRRASSGRARRTRR